MMAGKVWLGLLLAFSLLLTSCYPQLSVQQYDQLRKDIAALDTKRQALEDEIATLRAKHLEMRAYTEFLSKVVATQNSEKTLSGQFDADSLVKAHDELAALAQRLGDNEIGYFIALLKPENSGQMVSTYNKIIEYCLKKLKQDLE